jgi:hypothetical protein
VQSKNWSQRPRTPRSPALAGALRAESLDFAGTFSLETRRRLRGDRGPTVLRCDARAAMAAAPPSSVMNGRQRDCRPSRRKRGRTRRLPHLHELQLNCERPGRSVCRLQHVPYRALAVSAGMPERGHTGAIVQRKLSNGVAGFAAGGSSQHRQNIAAMPASASIPPRILALGPSCVSPSSRRIVSVARIRRVV